ncbi:MULTISPECIES: LysM peptidoglycan-binding domain-containing protein [Rhodobacterales]|uniref:LysM peptidoglycan-binding domain-containing protein n=1 Tax=Rhodobacterales TaxID=204455 RepID=UPI00215DC004|nr:MULTISPECIES: LysM peptidoglycan-binding domain-containing protein [Rhodobacterales]MDO6589783.1 LysM peptidoglycan-binding domain-containing protein [Yoonia sp. 1_MG-2023]
MTEASKSKVVRLALGAIALVAVWAVSLLFGPERETSDPIAQVDSPANAAPAEEIAQVTPEEPAAPQGPQFDTFRVETDGAMVIAGRADPGQEIAIMLGGTELERVTADGAGNFVALPMAGVSDTPRSLTLVADPDAAALRSETSYIVAPIAAPAPVVAQLAVPELPNQIAAPQAPTAAPTQTSSATQPAAPAAPAAPEVAAAPIAAPERPAAPTVLQADAQGVRVVQSGPELPAPNVGLDAITYDPEGEVQLSGRAVGDGAVQIYLDNEPVTTSPVTEGGDWQIDLPEIETGIYTLRVDEVDNAGDVVSRLETPFKREEAADVAAVLAEETGADGFEVAVRTVQPGATLWAIAEESLGNGVYYVQVYEANSDLIRDPDLIYPGQIFRMPEVSQ